MKLTELNPHWVGAGGEGVFNRDGSPAEERHGVAISFDCPCGKNCEQPRCIIEFQNPVDGKPGFRDDNHSWKREGDTFETLTLTPSIQRIGGCKWHGWITKGEVITV